MKYPEHRAHLLDSQQESLQRLCRLTASTLRTGTAVVYKVNDDGDWKQCGAFPAELSRFSIDDSIALLIGTEDRCEVEDLRREPGFSKHEWVNEVNNIRFVASALLTPDDDQNRDLGFLVVTGEEPRQFTSEDRELFAELAKTASDLIELQSTRRQNWETKKRLREERSERVRLIDELESSNSKLEQFAYLASHDLQEPLRMVTGFLGLLKEEYANSLDEDAREYIGFAVDGALRMRQMINDLLSYSRMWSSTEPFLTVSTEEVLLSARNEILNNYPEEKAEITSSAMPVVAGRSKQLHRLFSNLLANAIQHSGENARVDVWSEEREDHYLFAVVDHGVGVPEDQQERIFEVFVSGSNDSSRSGSGIGLSICAAIVEQHGGRLWVESPHEQGATFYFTISKQGPA